MAIDRLTLFDELRAAANRQRRHARHTIGLALILAIGIGSTVGIFHVAYEALHRPLPYQHVNRLVAGPELSCVLTDCGSPYPPDPSLHTVFVSGAQYFYDLVRVEFASRPKEITVAFVTPQFFSTLGVRPAIGSAWPSNYQPPDVFAEKAPWLPMVLSHHLWVGYFGADRRVIGAEMWTYGRNRYRYQIVGVAPRGVNFPPGVDAWAAADAFSPRVFQVRGSGMASAGGVGLLRPGLSIRSAEARIAAWPSRAHTPIRLAPIRRLIAGDLPQLAQILWFSTALLLALATLAAVGVSRANLEQRRTELEIKSFLGAQINRLQLSLAIELGLVLLLSLLASVGIRDLVASVTERYFHLSLSKALNWPEIGMAAGPALIVLVAALIRQRNILAPAASAIRGVRPRVRVSVQWAVATVVLLTATLLGQSGYRLLHASLGLNPRHVFVCGLDLALSPSGFYSNLKKQMSPAETRRVEREDDHAYYAAIDASYRDLLARLKSSRLVRRAGLINISPYSSYAPELLGDEYRVSPDAAPSSAREVPMSSALRSVSSGAFGALGMTFRYGRGFSPSDDTTPRRVVVVNEAWARHFGGKALLGEYLWSLWLPGFRVIGILHDVGEKSVFAPPEPTVYYPLWHMPPRSMDVIVRASANASGGAVLDLIRKAVKSVRPDTSISDFSRMSSMVRSTETESMYAAMYLLALAAIALLLVSVAAWVETSDEAYRRRHEIGIRMAVGATARDVMWLMAKNAVTFGALSVAAGGLAAWWFVRLFSHLLFRTGFSQPFIFLPVMLAIVGYLAIVHALAARLALRRNPVELISHL
jgi:putative ABC transport system permease protein